MQAAQYYEFIIEGMRCAACAARLERILNRHPQFRAEVNFASGQAVIFVEENLTPQEIINVIKEAGFQASLLEEYDFKKDELHYQKEKCSLRRNFIFSVICTIPIMLLMMGPFWLVLCLMSIVQFWCGRFFYKHAYSALKNKHMTMDVLVALGTSIAYFYNIFAFFFLGLQNFYPDTSAMVICLVLLGRLLELKARHKARSGIESMIQTLPVIAHKEREGSVEDCSIQQLVEGDVIIIRPGEVIPIDGVILEGQSEINESLLTGETLPVLRKEGDEVFAATLNHQAILRVKVVATGRKTAFLKIINFVEKAQSSKPHIQKIADNVTAYFVPLIIFCAFLSFCGSFIYGGIFSASLLHAVSVLVVACPCALGLATPITLMVGTEKGAALGILFQDSQILERSQKITHFIFDKTGTLTEGKPSLISSYICPPYEEDFLLSCAFSMERDSEHPLAYAVREAFEAIRNKAGPQEITPLSFVSSVIVKPGKGLMAELQEGGMAYIGAEEFLAEYNIYPSLEAASWLQKEREEARIAVIIAWKDHVIGCLSFTDPLREEASALISFLKKKNIVPLIVTGDHAISAQILGKKLGIEQIRARILPEGKAEIIQQLQKDGAYVAMIGDGLNDAPALSVADVSFAMGHGSAISLEASDIILMRNNLGAVREALELSRAILWRIYQNLALAFLYNLICVPLAALGFLTPILASFAMGLSSLSVVFNALRLKLWHPKSGA